MPLSGEHCLHLRRSLQPHAKRSLEKARKTLVAILPDYFDSFDASSETSQAAKDEDCFVYLTLFVAFVEQANFHASQNRSRGGLSPNVRLTLYQEEARILHHLKSHVELLEAYRWHQISARRQDNSLLQLRNGGLPADGLLVQIDFKENVRYPLRYSAAFSICFFLASPQLINLLRHSLHPRPRRNICRMARSKQAVLNSIWCKCHRACSRWWTSGILHFIGDRDLRP